MPAKNKNHNKTPVLLLRSGLAIVFLYAAISSFKTPDDWIGYLPHFLTTTITAPTLLKFFAAYELLIAIWLISGYYLKAAAAVCTVTLAGIVIANPHELIVTFRDFGLAFAALSLAFIED